MWYDSKTLSMMNVIDLKTLSMMNVIWFENLKYDECDMIWKP
jgi:hypothetical protein